MEKAKSFKMDDSQQKPVSQKEIQGHGLETDSPQTRPEELTKENIAFLKDFIMTEILSSEELSKAHTKTGKMIKSKKNIINYQKI